MNDLTSILINWFPLVLIMGGWFYFMRKMQNPSSGITYANYLEQSLKTQQEQNKALLAIVDRMDRRIADLERTKLAPMSGPAN
jgi:ATP-dependent Zn protease